MSRAWWVVLGCSIVLAVVTGSGSLQAQPQAPTPAAAAPKDDAAKSRARVHFEKGITAYREGRFKDAIDAFLDAHREYPSPTLSFNTARAYEKMGDSAGALRFYREYLRQNAAASDKATVEARVSELEGKLQARGLQQVTILSKPEGATVILDDRPVGVTPWTGEIFPGGHRVRLRREGHQDASKEFELQAHRAMDLQIELTKAVEKAPEGDKKKDPSAEPTADRTESAGIGVATWVTLGVGVAALGGAVVFEVLRGQSEEDVKNEETQVARHDAFDSMETQQTTSRVLAGVGAAALIAGGVLLYFDLSKDSKETPAQVGFACDGMGCAGAVRGRW